MVNSGLGISSNDLVASDANSPSRDSGGGSCHFVPYFYNKAMH